MTVGTHIRAGRVVGQSGQLTDKAVKVLAKIRFADQALSIDDLNDRIALDKQDIMRQLEILMRAGLIFSHMKYPRYPQEGFRVYTKIEDNPKIMAIIRSRNIWDEPTLTTQRTLRQMGVPFRKGMMLEGFGRQPNNGNYYPGEVLVIEDLDFKPETIRAMKKWRMMHVFKPKDYSEDNVQVRLTKYRTIIKELSKIYGIPEPKLILGEINETTWKEPGSSGSSYFRPGDNTITLNGRLSVITLLHEFGHARGFDEVDTIIWSTNIFKRFFSKSFSRLVSDNSHVLSQTERSYSI